MPKPTSKDQFMYKLIMDWLVEVHDKKYPDKNDGSSSTKRIFMLLEVLVTEMCFGRNKKMNEEAFVEELVKAFETMLKNGIRDKKEFDKKKIDKPIFIDKTQIVD